MMMIPIALGLILGLASSPMGATLPSPAQQDFQGESADARIALCEQLREAYDKGTRIPEGLWAGVPGLIASPNLWQAKLGAYFAGKHGRVECVPALLKALESEGGAKLNTIGRQEHVLDALVRLDAYVPASLLARETLGKNNAAVVILLARDPSRAEAKSERKLQNEVLLAILDVDQSASAKNQDSRPQEYWAAASILAARQVPGVAARIALDLHSTVNINVVDEVQDGSLIDFDSNFHNLGGWAIACGSYWPPKPSYFLMRNTSGVSFLNQGELTYSWQREEGTKSGRSPVDVMAPDGTACALGALSHMLGESGQSVHQQTKVPLAWSTQDALDDFVEEQRAAARQRFEYFFGRLEKAGLITTGESERASLRLVLGVAIWDWREGEEGEELPNIE
jgi:hypothetical protein